MNKMSKLWTSQFITIVVMAFFFFVCLQLLTAGFPAYITEIKQNPTQGGLMTTVFMLAAIVTRLFVGFLIQRINMKVMSIVSLLLVLITVGLSFNQTSVVVLLVLRALHGIGFGIVSTILATMATTIIPVHRLGEGIGYYGLATSIGTTIAPMLALSILQFFSYNFLILLSVVFTVATLVLSFFIKAGKPSRTKPTSENEIPLKNYAYDSRALFPCLLTIFFTVTLGGVLSFLRELGKEVGLGGSVSLFFLMMAVVMVIVRPVSGRLFDKYGHKVIIYPATISGILGLFLLAITQNTLTILAAGVLYGIAYGTVTPTFQAIAVSNVPKEKQGTANAMFFSSMDLGIAIGSTGLGMLASYTDYRFIYGFSMLFLILLLLGYRLIIVKGVNPFTVFSKWKSPEAGTVNTEAK